MVKFLLLAAILLNSPFARSGPLTYDFEVVVQEKGIKFEGMFTAVESVWADTYLRKEEITDFSVMVSDGLCCAYDFVPSFPGGTPPTGGVYIPRARFAPFTVTMSALERGSFFIQPQYNSFNLSLREFFLDGTELRASVSVSLISSLSTIARVAYWDPGGIFNRDRTFQDYAVSEPHNPFAGQPPFAFALTLRPAEVPIPMTLSLLAIGLAGLFSLQKLSPLSHTAFKVILPR